MAQDIPPFIRSPRARGTYQLLHNCHHSGAGHKHVMRLEDGLVIQSGADSDGGFCCLPSPKDHLSLPAPDGDHTIHCFQTLRHRFVHDAGQDQLSLFPRMWQTQPFPTWSSPKHLKILLQSSTSATRLDTWAVTADELPDTRQHAPQSVFP